VSTPALSLPALPAVPSRSVRRLGPATVMLGTAALLGAAMATGSPVMIAAAILPFLVAMLARPDSATLIFAICFYINLPVLASRAGAGSLLGSAFVLLLVAPWVAYVIVGRRPLVFTPAIALMVGFLVAMVVSAAVAGHATPGSAGDIGVYLVEGLVLVILVVNVIRTPGVLRNVVWMVLAAGATMGGISLWQELTHSYHTDLGGLAQVESLKFHVMHGTQAVSRPRLAGPIGEKNRYAQILLVLLPLAVWLIRTERVRFLRFVGILLSTLILTGALLTFSRGAFVALVFTALVALSMRFLRVRHVLPIALALVALMFAVAPDFVSRVQSLGAADSALSHDTNEADGAVVGRATESLAAFNTFRDHPLIGVGPGEFFRSYSQKAGNQLDLRYLETRRHAHNLYLEMAADLGILGLGLFMAIVIVTLVQLQRLARFWARRRPDMAQLAQALVLSLVAYLASGMFLQLSFQRYFWFLIALANATIWMLSRAAREARPR
jgi:O-antigen ligase